MAKGGEPDMSKTEAVFLLKGAPATHADGLVRFLEGQGWKVASAGLAGKASRGSKVLNVIFGAFAQYFEVAYELAAEGEDTALRFRRATSGVMGGAIGASRVRKHFQRLALALEEDLGGRGALLETHVV